MKIKLSISQLIYLLFFCLSCNSRDVNDLRKNTSTIFLNCFNEELKLRLPKGNYTLESFQEASPEIKITSDSCCLRYLILELESKFKNMRIQELASSLKLTLEHDTTFVKPFNPSEIQFLWSADSSLVYFKYNFYGGEFSRCFYLKNNVQVAVSLFRTNKAIKSGLWEDLVVQNLLNVD
jgi:hypothetical protein